MSIQIYFAGLICHSGNDSGHNGDQTIKTRSIIVPDADHKPFITIKGQVVMKEITTPITFDIPGGALATDPAFAQCVPRLATLANLDVVLRNGVGSEIQLPAGVLYVASYFKVGGVYTLGPSDVSYKCVAHYTMLRANESKLTITVNHKPYDLKSGDFVFIENASVDKIANEGDHWAKYTKILGGSKKLATYKKGLPKEDCPLVDQGDHLDELPLYSQDQKKEGEKDLAAASSECSNSSWP